jgi:hypothetical protein
MDRPNKKDYLTTNQFEYNELLNKYYDDLEAYVDKLEKKLILSGVSNHVCECAKTTQVNKINDSWICTECNKSIHQ